MSGPAEIIVAGCRDTFAADECRIEYGAVHAAGRWRIRYGPNNRLCRYSEPVARMWPIQRVEIRWTDARAAA